MKFDFHYGTATSQFDNHVIVDAGDGRQFVDGHLRHGLPWHRGETVHEGNLVVSARPFRGEGTVGTSLVARDPDYGIVRYRYRWSVGARVLRRVTSAGLTDVLERGLAKPGETVRCAVTPSDGKATGRTVSAAARVPG